MNLADAVAIVISRPFALARRMANRDIGGVASRSSGDRHPIRRDGAFQPGGFQHKGLKVRSRTVF